MQIKYLLILLLSFCFALILSPIIINASKKLKAKQTILKYVTEHKQKQGTPTMGGLIFILTFLFVPMFFLKDNVIFSVFTILITLSFAVLGFLDDFLKIHFKQNLGLKPYQKIIGQVGISLIIAMFVYSSNLLGSKIYLPFSSTMLDLGIFIVPFVVFVFLATVNSVNLIDGLDGLATGVSFAYILGFLSVLLVYNKTIFKDNFEEIQNLQLLSCCMLGSLFAYFLQNCFPAKIFMGDTGSLALGGFITSLAVFTKLELYIPILGIMYVITALSDILQVAHYKRTKKRIFLMAPIHHHFQQKGVHENRVVVIYILTTIMVSVLTIILLLLVGK